jgi:5-(carboxyamino)imidazole ribonucleotide synthase
LNLFSSPNFKLGILGGGQLGKMLLDVARKWDIHTCVLDANPQAPSAGICNEFFQGDLMDFNMVYNFGKKVNLLTIEIEHVNIEALEQLEKEGVQVFPEPAALKVIQHKGLQKDFFKKHHIPTAAYQRHASLNDLKKELPAFPFVWKSSKFGYDGMGVSMVRNEKDLLKLPNVDCICEALVPFKKEIAVIVAQSKSKEIKTYPVVEMEFHPTANQVEYIISPARISAEISEKATACAINVAKAFNATGLLAVEMFLTHNNQVLVNEVAPRTHNSGHYTIEGSYTSQFEQHLRSILGLALGNTENTMPSVLVNLVGKEGHTGAVTYQGIEKSMTIAGVYVHLYGKKTTKPFRKMGHVNVINKHLEQALEIAKQVKESVQVVSK